MALKVGGLAEALIAQVAGEGLQAGMNDGMLPQVGRVVEALFTFRTLVKLLPCRSELHVHRAMVFEFLFG